MKLSDVEFFINIRSPEDIMKKDLPEGWKYSLEYLGYENKKEELFIDEQTIKVLRAIFGEKL